MSFLQVIAFLFMVWRLLLHFCPHCHLMSDHSQVPLVASLLICIETDRKKTSLPVAEKNLTGCDRWDLFNQYLLWELGRSKSRMEIYLFSRPVYPSSADTVKGDPMSIEAGDLAGVKLTWVFTTVTTH